MVPYGDPVCVLVFIRSPLFEWAIIGMSVPGGFMGFCVHAFLCVVSCVYCSRAWRLPAFVSFAPNRNVRWGSASEDPNIRELRGFLVAPVSPLLYFVCCGRMRVCGVCAEWGLGGLSIAYWGVGLV